MKINHLLFCVAAVFSALLLSGCGRHEVKKEIPPRPVQTALAAKKDVPFFIDSFGYINVVYNVNIVSQVTGKVMESLFVEGQHVKKGDKLFTIDKAPYQADLDKALAELAKDQAQLKLDQDNLERNRPLVKEKVISEQAFEQYVTNVALDKAKIDLDKANIETTRINLGYCDIVSPVDGITSKRLVDPGNTVPANTGPTLVNIRSIDPIYVDFNISEAELDRVRSAMASDRLKVEMKTQDGKSIRVGELSLLENTVDTRTGTALLRATAENKDSKFWPGQFVLVRLILGMEKEAIVLPENAVQLGMDGYYSFRVKDGKAELVKLSIGTRNESLIVVHDCNIKEGDKVVVVGQMSLSPGVAVKELPADGTAQKK
jgi:membrane fusion protein, multidrug efflux system